MRLRRAGGRIDVGRLRVVEHERATDARRRPSLRKNVFGVGIGRWMIAAETYSWAGQYIGDVCERCEMNGNSGHRCVRAQRLKKASILHTEAAASARCL